MSSDSIEIMLVFCDAEPHWWNRFLKPGFRHVYAMTLLGDDEGSFWVGAQFHPWGIDLELARYVELDHVVNPEITEYRWLHINAERVRGLRVPHIFQPLSCVELVKAMCGIRAPWVITPWQLWRHCIGQSVGITEIDRGRRCRRHVHGSSKQDPDRDGVRTPGNGNAPNVSF